jgi:Tol biopolymer transport system component
MEIFSARVDQPEARSIGLPGADLMAIAPNGAMLVSLGSRFVELEIRSGTLAETTIGGGVAPRELMSEVQWADWAPDGKTMAVVRAVGQKSRLEYPPGKVLYETFGWMTHPRVSRDGDSVAFLEHPFIGENGGTVGLVDRNGTKRTLTRALLAVWGLAWSPTGREVWYTAMELPGLNRALKAVSLSGRERLLVRIPRFLTLQDVARDGRALISHDANKVGVRGLAPGETAERELSWRELSAANGISTDGKHFLFLDVDDAGNSHLLMRGTDGSQPLRLGDGSGTVISDDGRWVLGGTATSELARRLVLYPTGPGETKILQTGDLVLQLDAALLPESRDVVFTAHEPGRGLRLFRMDLAGGKPEPITPEGYRAVGGVSRDGKFVVVGDSNQAVHLWPLGGGEPTPVRGLDPKDGVTGWTNDGRLFLKEVGSLPARVFKLDPRTGKRELWRELMPADPAGVVSVNGVYPAPDGRAYVYTYARVLSDLYLVKGIR